MTSVNRLAASSSLSAVLVFSTAAARGAQLNASVRHHVMERMAPWYRDGGRATSSASKSRENGTNGAQNRSTLLGGTRRDWMDSKDRVQIAAGVLVLTVLGVSPATGQPLGSLKTVKV